MIMVIAVCSILAAVAIPSFLSWIPDFKLKGAAGGIRSDIYLARQKAMRENDTIAVVFDLSANQYSLFVDNGAGGGTANARNWIRDGDEELIKTITLPGDVVMYSAAFAGGVSRFRFDGRGVPNGLGGSVRLKNRRNKCRAVIVSMFGRVREQASEDGGTTWRDID